MSTDALCRSKFKQPQSDPSLVSPGDHSELRKQGPGLVSRVSSLAMGIINFVVPTGFKAKNHIFAISGASFLAGGAAALLAASYFDDPKAYASEAFCNASKWTVNYLCN